MGTTDPHLESPDGMFAAFLGLFHFAATIGELVVKIEETRPPSGYEPLLRKHGSNPISARGFAWLVRRRADRITAEQREMPAVRDAVLALAKAPHKRATIQRKAVFLCKIYERSTLIEILCERAGLDSLEFVGVMRKAAAGNDVACQQLCNRAKELRQRCELPKGPKVRTESIAHEFLFQVLAEHQVKACCVRDNYSEQFRDEISRATIDEYNNPNFDPRPALRRYRASLTR